MIGIRRNKYVLYDISFVSIGPSRYVILGALALVPLAQGHHWYKECPVELKATIDRWNKRWPGDRDGRASRRKAFDS